MVHLPPTSPLHVGGVKGDGVQSKMVLEGGLGLFQLCRWVQNPQTPVKPLSGISKSRIGLPVLCILLAVHSQLLSFSKGWSNRNKSEKLTCLGTSCLSQVPGVPEPQFRQWLNPRAAVQGNGNKTAFLSGQQHFQIISSLHGAGVPGALQNIHEGEGILTIQAAAQNGQEYPTV